MDTPVAFPHSPALGGPQACTFTREWWGGALSRDRCGGGGRPCLSLAAQAGPLSLPRTPPPPPRLCSPQEAQGATVVLALQAGGPLTPSFILLLLESVVPAEGPTLSWGVPLTGPGG